MEGDYREIDEKGFFDAGKSSQFVVCHFADTSLADSASNAEAGGDSAKDQDDTFCLNLS